MNNVLMIAYFFPPTAATAGMRPLNFCRHLPAHGWTARVLATNHVSALPPQPVDQKLVELIPRDVHVIRVGHANPRGRLLQFRERVRRLLHRDGPVPFRSVSESAPSARIASLSQRKGSPILQLLATRLLEFPDLQCPWYRPALRALSRLSVQERPQVIWATGGPWTSLLVGKRLSEKWNVPFVADFRDPWVEGQDYAALGPLQRRAQGLERSVCAAAARVILNTDELRMKFIATYPEYAQKFVTITNGYAAELEAFCLERRGNSHTQLVDRPSHASIELCHFGTIYGNRSPIALFRALEELVSGGRVSQSDLRLRFVGGWEVEDTECERLAKRLQEMGMLRRDPPIPHRQCLEEMLRADLLLVLQHNYPLQIPAKIYEYIVAGRPLMVIGGEGATANLVERHRLGRCCPNRLQEIKRTLLSILSFETGLVSPSPEDTAQFSYHALSGRLAEILSMVSTERAARFGS